MGKYEKKAYLKQIKGRHKKASKAEKKRILDEFCAVCGCPIVSMPLFSPITYH